MRIIKLGGGVAAAVAVMGLAVPAEAQRYRGRGHHHRGGDRIDAGDVLLGAALLGGLLALSSAKKKQRERAEADVHEEEADSPARYDGTYVTETAQDRCADEAETLAQNYARLSRVSALTGTVWNGGSWTVKGAIELADSEDSTPRTHRWRCALRAGSEPVVTFEGL